MKQYIIALTVIALLTACEDTNKAADKAKQAASETVEKVKDTVESINFDDLKLDGFDGAMDQAKAFTTSVKDALTVDFNDSAAVEKIKNSIANAYRCLVDASSEVKAGELIDTLINKIKNEEATALIQQAVEKGATLTQCMSQ